MPLAKSAPPLLGRPLPPAITATAVGQASEAHGHDTVAVGRGAVAGADLSSDKDETYRYSNVAKDLADITRPSKVETVQIGKNVYQD